MPVASVQYLKWLQPSQLGFKPRPAICYSYCFSSSMAMNYSHCLSGFWTLGLAYASACFSILTFVCMSAAPMVCVCVCVCVRVCMCMCMCVGSHLSVSGWPLQLMAALIDVKDAFGDAGIPSAPGRFRACKCKDAVGNYRPCIPPQIGFLVCHATPCCTYHLVARLILMLFLIQWSRTVMDVPLAY